MKNLAKIRKILGNYNTKKIFERVSADFYKFDEADVITGMYAMKNNMDEVFDTNQSQLVLEAIRRSTNELDIDSSINDIRDYISKYSETQLEGITNNVKGIYHELLFEVMENEDGDDIFAELFEKTNHPDSDVMLLNTKTGEREYVQLKATDDIYYVNDALEENPTIRVLSTEEVADKLGIDSTWINNQELNEKVEEVLEELKNPNEFFDDIPSMAVWSTVFVIVPIIHKMIRKEIVWDVGIKRIAKITGMKAVRVITLVGLLSFPLTAMPTSIYLIMKYSSMVYRSLFLKSDNI